MPKESLTSHHCQQLKTLSPSIHKMCFCWNCVTSDKACCIAEGSEKCVECVRSGKSCDLVSLNTTRYHHLKEKHKKFKAELNEAHAEQIQLMKKVQAAQQCLLAKQQRLLQQVKSVEGQQNRMLNNKYQNMEELETEEVSTNLPDMLIDMHFKQLVMSNSFNDLFWFSFASDDGMLEVPSDSSSGS